MRDLLLALDQQLFLFLYQLPHVFIVESIARFLSAVGSWGGVWLGIAIYLFFREEKRDHWFFFPSVLVILGAAISEFMLKEFIARPRPTNFIDTYSFPSTHAVLAFAFAYILSRKEPRLRMWFYVLAVFISFSRIYLGVHYPLDITAGAFLGIIIGWFSLMLESSVRRKLIRKLPSRSKKIR